MEDMCTGCLSTGRKLFFIGDTEYYDIYSQIMNEIPMYDTSVVCVRLCWECRARLRAFHLFRERVVRSLTELMQQTPLRSTSTLSYQLQHNLCYPDYPMRSPEHPPEHLQHPPEHPQHPLDTWAEVEVKTEVDVDEMKWPVVEHCEPEPFADAFATELVSEDDSDEPLKKKKKEVKTNKIKVKKKRKKKADNIETEDNKEDIQIEETDYNNSDREKEKKKRKKKVETIETEDNKEDIQIEEKDYKDSDREKDSLIEKQSVVEKEILPIKEEPEVKEKIVKKVRVVRVEGGKATAERPQCQECGKVFSSKKTYRYHLNVLHKGQNRYPCPRCGKVYQWKSNLGRHMRSHKAVDDGELFCAVCDKSFASVATYRQHLRLSRSHVPEAEFSFACEECGKRFVNKTRLRDHIDWEHLNRIKFRCQLCNKPFKCHTSLYVHTQNVHVGKEKKDNLCHVCGKSYQNAAKLKYHITAMHSGETPYRCGQCAAAFGWYSSLYRHMREVHYKMKGVSKKAKKTKQRDEIPQYAAL